MFNEKIVLLDNKKNNIEDGIKPSIKDNNDKKIKNLL